MYLFTGETLKTCYLLPLFLFGLPQFQVSKCPTSSFGFFSLQCKLLQKCTFSRPAIIYEIIIQLCLISVRRNEVGDAWHFLTVNRVTSFIYIMPQGFLNSTPNWQTTLSAQAWKLTEHNAVRQEEVKERLQGRTGKAGFAGISKWLLSRQNAPFHYLQLYLCSWGNPEQRSPVSTSFPLCSLTLVRPPQPWAIADTVKPDRKGRAAPGP